MKKGMLIVMEGACDGIGKSTQYELLKTKLENDGYQVVKHHFPSYNTFHGSSVEAYLSGKFGSIEELTPYFINSLYATDRACAWYLNLKKEYDSGKIILLDRYTTSSLIYQSCLIDDYQAKKEFIEYTSDYEYNKLNIATPDIVIFLNAPFDLVTKLRNERKNNAGIEGDIYEKNLDIMKKVYDSSQIVSKILKFQEIKCSENNEFRSIEDISEDIYKIIIDKINHKS